jgi:hypothetical protein
MLVSRTRWQRPSPEVTEGGGGWRRVADTYPRHWTSSSAILVAAVRRRRLHRLARSHGSSSLSMFHNSLLPPCSGTRRAGQQHVEHAEHARTQDGDSHTPGLPISVSVASSLPLETSSTIVIFMNSFYLPRRRFRFALPEQNAGRAKVYFTTKLRLLFRTDLKSGGSRRARGK